MLNQSKFLADFIIDITGKRLKLFHTTPTPPGNTLSTYAKSRDTSNIIIERMPEFGKSYFFFTENPSTFQSFTPLN